MTRDAGYIGGQECCIDCSQRFFLTSSSGMLDTTLQRVAVAVFVTDAGVRVLERCWLECLAGKWKCLVDRETGFIV